MQYDNCYCKIASVNGSKDEMGIFLNVLTSADSGYLLERKYYSFTPSVADNSENFIKQGYEYLKTLPEFADVIDC